MKHHDKKAWFSWKNINFSNNRNFSWKIICFQRTNLLLNEQFKFSLQDIAFVHEQLICSWNFMNFQWKIMIFQWKTMILHEISWFSMKRSLFSNDKLWFFMKNTIRNEQLVAWRYSWLCFRTLAVVSTHRPIQFSSIWMLSISGMQIDFLVFLSMLWNKCLIKHAIFQYKQILFNEKVDFSWNDSIF